MVGDLHCHTKLSDSSMGIDDLIALAKKRGVETIAITDHDCLAGTVRGKIIGERRGIKVVPGVELSCYDSSRESYAHLLCYLSDSPDRLEGLCHRNTLARKKASQYMMLKTTQRYPITPDLVLKCAAGSTCVYEQHIMHALMECGLTDRIYGDLYNELFSAESPDNVLVTAKFPEPAEVLASIHASGGIAVLAHPSRYDSLNLLDELIPLGLDGIEVWYPGASPKEEEYLREVAKKNKLLMIGGSGFSGMYGYSSVTVGSYITPEEQLKSFFNYKTQRKRNNKNKVPDQNAL